MVYGSGGRQICRLPDDRGPSEVSGSSRAWLLGAGAVLLVGLLVLLFSAASQQPVEAHEDCDHYDPISCWHTPTPTPPPAHAHAAPHGDASPRPVLPGPR